MLKKYFVFLSFTVSLLPAFGACDISGLDREEVVQALYRVAKPQGRGLLKSSEEPLSREEAAAALAKTDGDLDYVKGHVMKIFLPKGAESFDSRLFNRDNGQNSAEKAIAELKATKKS